MGTLTLPGPRESEWKEEPEELSKAMDRSLEPHHRIGHICTVDEREDGLLYATKPQNTTLMTLLHTSPNNSAQDCRDPGGLRTGHLRRKQSPRQQPTAAEELLGAHRPYWLLLCVGVQEAEGGSTLLFWQTLKQNH